MVSRGKFKTFDWQIRCSLRSSGRKFELPTSWLLIGEHGCHKMLTRPTWTDPCLLTSSRFRMVLASVFETNGDWIWLLLVWAACELFSMGDLTFTWSSSLRQSKWFSALLGNMGIGFIKGICVFQNEKAFYSDMYLLIYFC